MNEKSRTYPPNPNEFSKDMPEPRRRLAYAIRAAITFNGVSEVKLARRIGRSANTVMRWANGTTVMSALDVKPLADALEVSYDLFVDPPEVPEYLILKQDQE